MQLIMLYTICNESSCDHIDVARPIIADSPEAAIEEFDNSFTAAYHKNQHTFMFAGYEFHRRHFLDLNQPLIYLGCKIYLPNFITVDEWFARAEKEKLK